MTKYMQTFCHFNLPPYLVVPYLWIQENPSAIKWVTRGEEKSPQFVSKWKMVMQVGIPLAESLQIADRYCMIVTEAFWSDLDYIQKHSLWKQIIWMKSDTFTLGLRQGLCQCQGQVVMVPEGCQVLFSLSPPTHQVHSGIYAKFSSGSIF